MLIIKNYFFIQNFNSHKINLPKLNFCKYKILNLFN
jgi:hypothetical protein